MRKIYFSIVLILSGFNILFSQSIEYSPSRSNPGPFYNYTVVGFFTAAPPVIDAVIDDYCWTRPTAPATALSGGAGFDGTNFPANQQIKEQINIADGGTVAPNAVPANPYTAGGGVYPASAGTFAICWDLKYVYFTVKIINQAAADLTDATNDRGIDIFFNNGNGRSGVADPINDSYPKKYNNLRDMEVQLWYLPKPGDTDFPLLGAVAGLANYGISLPPSDYKFAVKKTVNGYIYEGRIAWTTLNKEFINDVDGSYVDDGPNTQTGVGTLPTSKWRPFKGRLLGLDVGAALYRGSPGPPEQMNWNECCFNVNWSRSAYYGYFLLAGDTTSVVCPTSYNVTLTSSSITSPNQKVTAGANSIFPLDAAREMNWQLIGSNGSYPIASIDNNTGIITPLNNGVLTIVGKSKITRCASTTVAGIVTLNIGGQVTPSSIVINAPDITTNWGTSNAVASVSPSSAPSDVIWSIEPTSNLATINSITGLIKATALGSGSVTVKSTSIANGLVGTKVINIATPVVISNCIGINAYQNIYQCNRTLNAMTIFGFNIGAKITLLAQYFDPATPSVPQSIPAELMKFTIQQSVPAASISQAPNWELVLNQPSGFFSITGVYLNDTTKRVQVKVSLKGTVTLPSCTSNMFNIGTACGNTVPGVDVTSVTIASSPSSLAVGSSNNYSANVLPANATNTSINWYSSNVSVGTISSTGYFYASSPGVTTITAISVSNPAISGSKLINIVSGSCSTPTQPSAFDNNSTSINAGLQSYNITSIAGITYVWSVSGSGNFIAFDNGNSVVINWANPGTLSVSPMNLCGMGNSRSIFVSNVNGVSCSPPAQPEDFDNKSTTVCPGNVTYKVPFSNSVAYIWSVTGTGNSIFTANSNIATINWVNPGTLYVSAIVGSCQSVSRSLTISSTAPPAKPTISTAGSLTFCLGKLVILTSSSLVNNIWSSGETTQSITVTGSGYYKVTVGENCNNTSDSTVVSTLMPPPQSICIITVDNVTNHNQIVFEKPSNKANIKKWLIYSETTTTDFFDFMGTVFPTDPGLFVDNTSRPDTRAYKYKIQTVDTCGNEVSGDAHKTVHLTINKGLNDHAWNLIWNPYEGINVVSYRIYRGTSVANLAYIDAVSGSFASYTDSNAPDEANLYYVIEILTAGCNPNTRQESYESIRSNVAQTAVTTVKGQFSSTVLIISPNPSTGSFTVENTGFEALNYKLINSIGVVVGEGKFNTGKNTFSLNLSKGVYLFLTDAGSKKISIE